MTEDLSHLPTDWLEAFVELISEDNSGSLTTDIAAIYRMRDIERREGRNLTADPAAAREELANRKDPCGVNRAIRRAAEWEAAEQAEIKALVIDQCETEAAIGRGRYASLLLQRLSKLNARLAELLA